MEVAALGVEPEETGVRGPAEEVSLELQASLEAVAVEEAASTQVVAPVESVPGAAGLQVPADPDRAVRELGWVAEPDLAPEAREVGAAPDSEVAAQELGMEQDLA